MQQYIMGLDGGATKTHIALYNLETHRLTLSEFGPSNHEGMEGGFEELRGVLTGMFREAFGTLGIDARNIAAACMGMGGLDTPIQYDIIGGIYRDLGLANFKLANDAFLGLKAACPSGCGVSCVNGSGFSVVGVDPQGDMIQVGGIGSYTGDFGGGGYYVTQVVSAVYDLLFRDGIHTLLRDALFEIFETTDRDLYTEKVNYWLAERRVELYYRVCVALYDAANHGDRVALHILAVSGRQYARTIAACENNLRFPAGSTVEVALTGSQFIRGANRHAVDTIEYELKTLSPQYRHELIVLRCQPVTGALNWALELVGKPGDPTAREVFARELRVEE